MKKLFKALLAATLCISLASCSSAQVYPYYDMPVEAPSGIPCYMYTIDSLADIKEHSNVILQGILSDPRQETAYAGMPTETTYTLSTLTITKVIQGDLNSGDKIQLFEPYWVEEKDGQEVLKLKYAENYMPLPNNQEFLFFLSDFNQLDGWTNVYNLTSFELGRYPVIDAKARSVSGISAMTYQDCYLQKDDSLYTQLYEQAFEEYMQPAS